MTGLPEIGLVLAFFGGLISFFSPCVAPLAPGYLSLISGVSAASGGSVSSTGLSRSQTLMHTFGATLIFVLGFTLVFVALGAGAALFGGLLETYRQPLNRAIGVLMIAMGLLMAGVWKAPMLAQERRLHVSIEALGPSAPLLLGMGFGFAWVPCVGPILAGILLYASSTATVGTGIWLLFAYSLGLGVPFIISGLAMARITQTGRRLRRYWPWITRASGTLMVGMGFLFVTDRFFYVSIAMQRLYYSLP